MWAVLLTQHKPLVSREKMVPSEGRGFQSCNFIFLFCLTLPGCQSILNGRSTEGFTCPCLRWLSVLFCHAKRVASGDSSEYLLQYGIWNHTGFLKTVNKSLNVIFICIDIHNLVELSHWPELCHPALLHSLCLEGELESKCSTKPYLFPKENGCWVSNKIHYKHTSIILLYC